jgi:integrase
MAIESLKHCTLLFWRTCAPICPAFEVPAWLFPSDENPAGHQKTLKTVWHATLRRAKVPYFRIYDLRFTCTTRLSAGGLADEWVTQTLRQGDGKVFKKYSRMKLQDETREALTRRRSRFCHGRRVFYSVWAGWTLGRLDTIAD